MTIKELIAALSKFPLDAEVGVEAYNTRGNDPIWLPCRGVYSMTEDLKTTIEDNTCLDGVIRFDLAFCNDEYVAEITKRRRGLSHA